jgi:hypothetical protein
MEMGELKPREKGAVRMSGRQLIQANVPEAIYWEVKRLAAADHETLQEFTSKVFATYIAERRGAETLQDVLHQALNSILCKG